MNVGQQVKIITNYDGIVHVDFAKISRMCKDKNKLIVENKEGFTYRVYLSSSKVIPVNI